MDELFASCYVDEGILKRFSKILQQKGFDVVRAEDLGNIGLTDEEQLGQAIELKRTLITDDKRTFLKDSNSFKRKHYGIIVLTYQVNKHNAESLAIEIINKYLNRYAKDEFVGAVFYC